MRFQVPNYRQLIGLKLATVFLFLLAFYYHYRRGFDFISAKISSLSSSLRGLNLTALSPHAATSASDSSSNQPQDATSTPHNINRTLVIASLFNEDTSWASALSANDPTLTTAIYQVNNPYYNNATIAAPYLQVPQNKGHEVMVYLTYIIDTYSNLPDVAIFMHSHETSWHSNDFLPTATMTVKRLSIAKVLREGYVNLRCHRRPGCPDYLHPINPADNTTNSKENLEIKPEAAVMGKAWVEIFPTTPIPRVLSQPCCSQFAVSGARLRSVPLERYVWFREWLLATPLSDALSGRVWEYLWQFVLAGVHEYCPDEYSCYCETYGVCFGEGGREEYLRYYKLKDKKDDIVAVLAGLKKGNFAKENEVERKKKLIKELEVVENIMEEIKAKS
ncbi:hypothetical protein ACJ72_04456, partial [Emergomyces africanus]